MNGKRILTFILITILLHTMCKFHFFEKYIFSSTSNKTKKLMDCSIPFLPLKKLITKIRNRELDLLEKKQANDFHIQLLQLENEKLKNGK